MRLLADENVDTEWVRSLANDGHDVVRVFDDSTLGEGASDEAVLRRARAADRVLLTADRSDFGTPGIEDHAGIVLVTDPTTTGGEIRRGIRRIGRQFPDLTGSVAYLGDWL